MPTPVLEISDLRTYFHTDEGVIRAVDDLTFRFEHGRTLGIVGESGSGKSVTSLSIMRLLSSNAKIESGRIAFLGKDLVKLPEREMQSIRGRDISMIFQEPMTSLNPVFTVGAKSWRRSSSTSTSARPKPARKRSTCFAKSAFQNPEQRVDSYPHQMSGGQKQRVMIAMALSCNPQLLIADEPTTALDVTIQAQILEILRKLRDNRGMAIIFITHDLGVIAEIADDVLVMYPRRRSRVRPGARNLLEPQASLHQRPARLPPAPRNQISPPAHGRRLHGNVTTKATPFRIIEKKMDADSPAPPRNRRPRPPSPPENRTRRDRPPVGRRSTTPPDTKTVAEGTAAAARRKKSGSPFPRPPRHSRPHRRPHPRRR